MGKRAKEVLAISPEEVIGLLNRAFADEWYAYFQYWVGSRMVKGTIAKIIMQELEEHAEDELRHAKMLADRIIQLEGKPLLSPEAWKKSTTCGYDAPEDPSMISILKQNLKGERCAIDVYMKLLKMTQEKDPITAHIILGILKDELEHENDLQTLLEDLEAK